MNKILKFVQDESGATAIEYCLIASAIAIALVIAIQTLGIDLVAVFETISAALQ